MFFKPTRRSDDIRPQQPPVPPSTTPAATSRTQESRNGTERLDPSTVEVLPIEIGLAYHFPEPFGIAEVTHRLPAGRVYQLATGREIVNDDLKPGMQIVLRDGDIGTITSVRHFHEPPDVPVQVGPKLLLSRVVGTIKHKGIETLDVSWYGNIVTGSPEHKYYSVSRNCYIPAAELQIGEVLEGVDGQHVPVTAVGEKKLGLIDLYNVEVEHFHNYHVGQGPSVLVHNGAAGGPGYINTPADKGPAKGAVRSQHYSQSAAGSRLHQEAGAYRAAHPDGSNPHRNFATADVSIDGVRTTVRFKNDPMGMHSEQRLVAWHEAMTKRGRTVEVHSVYSERPPCGPLSANCADTLGNRFGSFLEVWHGDR